MALDPPLRRTIRRIAEAIEKYVESRGWPPEDVRWFYRANPDWAHIHIILVAPEFEGQDYLQNYQSLRAFLANELQDEPGLAKAIGLVLRTPKQIDEGGIYSIGPDYEDYEDFWAFRPVGP